MSTPTHPLGQHLLDNGFEYDADASTTQVESIEELQLNRGGEYQAHGCYRKAYASVTIERNTDTREEGGMSIMATYPPVAVVEGPKGRVACPADDFELVLRMVTELT